MRPVGPVLLLLALIVGGMSCQSAIPRHPLAPDDPRPRTLVAAWDEAARLRRGLRARATLAVDSEASSFRSNQVLVLERPSRLRVEVLGFLGQTLAVLVTDAERYEFLDTASRTYESGAVHDGLLWQYTRIDLSPDEAIDLLLGAPILDRTLVPIRAFETDRGTIQTDLADENGVVRERVAFDAAGHVTRFEVLDAAEALEWAARFEDYAAIEGGEVAHKIVLDIASGGSHAEITLRDVELAPALPAGLFQLRSP